MLTARYDEGWNVNLPYCQFYPRDWMGDAQLRLCSLAARGLWADMLCIMAMSARRGYLEVGGKPIKTPAEIGRLVGAESAEVEHLLAELESVGIPARDEAGTIFSRRIVKDSAVREGKRQAGLRGGNPNLVKRVVKQADNYEVKPVLEICLNPETRDQRPETKSSSTIEADASIPTIGEVIAFGASYKGEISRGVPGPVPKDFCEAYHEAKTTKNTWTNRAGFMVNWRLELIGQGWWRGQWQKWGKGGNGRPGDASKPKTDEEILRAAW